MDAELVEYLARELATLLDLKKEWLLEMQLEVPRECTP